MKMPEGGAQNGAHSRLVHVHAARRSEAQPRWLGELVQGVIADEGGNHAIQIAQESFQDLPEASDEVGKSLRQPAAARWNPLLERS